jgi:hypothetical protein
LGEEIGEAWSLWKEKAQGTGSAPAGTGHRIGSTVVGGNLHGYPGSNLQ